MKLLAAMALASSQVAAFTIDSDSISSICRMDQHCIDSVRVAMSASMKSGYINAVCELGSGEIDDATCGKVKVTTMSINANGKESAKRLELSTTRK